MNKESKPQLTWEEYKQESAKTALPSIKDNTDYYLLGLESEIGEICGKVKKFIRDQDIYDSKAIEKLKSDLKSELGDVYWYLAQLESHNFDYSSNRNCKIYEFAPLNDWITLCKSLVSIRRHLIGELTGVLGFTGSEIWEANLMKLQDRQARNALGGSGDER